jgi:nicotinamide mononucleotide transporter
MFSSMQIIEAIATIAGFINLYLIARANIYNWIFGILDVSLYCFIFYKTGLYADAILQIIYLCFLLIGWYQWHHKQMHSKNINYLPYRKYLLAFIIFMILDIGFMFYLSYFTTSTSVMLDALNTSMSLIAQWMMINCWIECWLLWSIANIVAISMYSMKSLYFTCLLSLAFLLFNYYGYRRWHVIIKLNRQRSTPLSCET